MVERSSWPYPRVLAHRGGGTLAPENTLGGLRAGHAHGFRGVEFDAKLTRDGVVILLHDDSLGRTTSGQGLAAQTDWEGLRGLDAGSWLSPQFAGEPIPTLAAALELCQQLHLWPNVEIKPCPSRERETGTAVALEVAQHWRSGTLPLLSSFSPLALEAAREAAPQLPRGLLVEKIPANWRDEYERLECFSLHCHFRAAKPAFLAAAAEAGIPVLCYTVNERKRALQLRAAGASAIVTDRLDTVPPDD